MASEARTAPPAAADATPPAPSTDQARRPLGRRLRWAIRLVVLAGVFAAGIGLLVTSLAGRRRLDEVLAADQRDQPALLHRLVQRHPLSPAAGRARVLLRQLDLPLAAWPPFDPRRATYALVLPAGLAALLAGTVLFTDWPRRQAPRGVAGTLLALGLLLILLQFDAVTDRMLTPDHADLLQGALTGPWIVTATWGFALAAFGLLYGEKRAVHGRRLRPWEVEKLLPARRTWALLAAALGCGASSLLVLTRPLSIGRWEVHMGLLGPLLAGGILGGRRGTLAVAAAALVALVAPGRFAGSFGSVTEALGDPAFAFVLGLPLVPATVAAGLGGGDRRRLGLKVLAFVGGLAVVYLAAVAAAAGAVMAGGASGLVHAAPRFASAALNRFPGDIVILAASIGATAFLGWPARVRRRAAGRSTALTRIAASSDECELLTLRAVADLLDGEEAQFERRTAALADRPLVARIREEFALLRQSLAARAFRLEQALADRRGVEADQLKRLPAEIKAIEAHLAGIGARRPAAGRKALPATGPATPEALTERLAAARRSLRDLTLAAQERERALAAFRATADEAYFRRRLDEMMGLMAVFRPLLPPDTDETAPKVAAALDEVGRYFAASTGPGGGPDETSRDRRREVALLLKSRMETEYRRLADEAATLTRQADALAQDLKALRDLWHAGAVTGAFWTAQQRAFAQLLDGTHRQLDHRRRVLSIYRRAEPPLDLP